MLSRFFVCCAILLTLNPCPSLADDGAELIPLNFGFYDGLQTSYHSSPYKPWLHAALKQEGYRPEIHWLPGRRILNQVNSGVLDGDLLRAEIVVKNNFPNLIKVDSLFGRACYAGYGYRQRDISQQQALRFGSIEGLLHVKNLAQKHWYNSEFTTITDPGAALKMLSADRLDLLLLPPNVVQNLEKSFGVQLIQLTPHNVQFDIFMFLHPRHEELAKKLALALTQTKPADLKIQCPSP